VYFNQIAKHLDLSNYILAWHIKILIKFDFIRCATIEKHDAFFDANLQTDNDEILFILSKEKSKQIIDYLLEHQEGVSKTQMSRELKIHSTTVSNYIKLLENIEIILKKELPRKTIFFLNERYYYDVLRINSP